MAIRPAYSRTRRHYSSEAENILATRGGGNTGTYGRVQERMGGWSPETSDTETLKRLGDFQPRQIHRPRTPPLQK